MNPTSNSRIDVFLREFSIWRKILDHYKIKLIVEPLLNNYEEVSDDIDLEMVCNMAIQHNFDYIKTHTGFGSRGVEVDDVKRIKDIVGDKIKIKASGGIKTLGQLIKLKEAGASRFGIGIDSAITIIKEL